LFVTQRTVIRVDFAPEARTPGKHTLPLLCTRCAFYYTIVGAARGLPRAAIAAGDAASPARRRGQFM
jgi:hypothetical protein